MEDSTTSSPDDPDPGYELSSHVGIEPSSLALKKEKARVRFNSNAGAPSIESPLPSPGSSNPFSRPRPSVLRNNSANSITTTRETEQSNEPDGDKAMSAAAAQARAKHVAAKVRRESGTKPSRPSIDTYVSSDSSDDETVETEPGIALEVFNQKAIDLHHDHGDEEEEDEKEKPNVLKEQAHDIVKAHVERFHDQNSTPRPPPADLEAQTDGKVEFDEINLGNYDGVYNVPAPETYRGSVLSQLLKLYKPTGDLGHKMHSHNSSIASSIGGSDTLAGSESGTATPKKKWYNQNKSQETLANLVGASARLANPGETEEKKKKMKPGQKKRKPLHKRNSSYNRFSALWQKDEQTRITVHIAETLARQDYIIKLCRALMLYGAPTHRLEEYMSMTARVLEIDGQFLYLPGCMIVSFDDKSTRTTEVRIVRSAQGIDLGRLKDVHHIYKEIVHDVIGVEEGTRMLDALMHKKEKYPPWVRVIVFGLTSVTVAPFSFSARLIDLPICFFLGCLVGLLQIVVAPRSQLYNNIFEISATVLVSFLARAFGSIRGGDLFCFSALAQGGIAMLLPGYTVLCSSLELQSRALVPGSIRIVYAIIYSLLIGFGITIGATLYGLFDKNATSATTCQNPIPSFYGFIFVPFYDLCICILYQAKWRQMPTMIVIAFAGYIVNFFSSLRFAASPQISNTLGALSVGVLANLYSRIRHGVAAAILIPAIFTQVPGGLASTGGLLSGLSTANLLTNASHPVNGTNTVQFKQGEPINGLVFNVAASMIQIAIGIAVGLFLSALIIYPLGKRRSGLFSF